MRDKPEGGGRRDCLPEKMIALAAAVLCFTATMATGALAAPAAAAGGGHGDGHLAGHGGGDIMQAATMEEATEAVIAAASKVSMVTAAASFELGLPACNRPEALRAAPAWYRRYDYDKPRATRFVGLYERIARKSAPLRDSCSATSWLWRDSRSAPHTRAAASNKWRLEIGADKVFIMIVMVGLYQVMAN